MRKAVFLLALLLLLYSSVRVQPKRALEYKTDAGWLQWKRRHEKSYDDDLTELERYVTWISNRALIEGHNTLGKEFGYTLALNQFADMSTSDYYYNTRCLYSRYSSQSSNTTHSDEEDEEFPSGINVKLFEWPKGLNQSYLPTEVDWRTMGAVADVKDQGRCKSCYAFSVTGALEGQHALATGKLVPLSEQNIVDCSVPYGNMGCSGGSHEVSVLYVIDNDGIATEASYPYIENQYLCRFTNSKIGATARGLVRIKKGQESDLMGAVAISGPVAVGIDHSHSAFQFYSSGIFDEPTCYSYKQTHSMLVTGYGTFNGKDYWLVKNSWGTTWGMNGYIMMVRGKYNQCGIATKAVYPT